MFLGAQYHRPPQPPRSDWDRDMRLMAESGLSVVRTWLYWISTNPKPGVWVWDEYDAFFEAARRNGFKVLVQLMLDSSPWWFQRHHPEALFVDENGNRISVNAHQAQQIGGAPGPCFHVEASRSGAEEYMRRVVERYRGHEALLAWDVWNEIWIRECYCPATQEQFRGWLLDKYGSLDAIDQAWYRNYGDIEEIVIPQDRGVYATMIDVARFRQWVRADSLRWRSDFVRSVDPKHPVVSHFTQPYSVTCDPWLLTDAVDAWGTSCYFGDFHDISILLDATRGASKGKTWWLSEEPGGHMSFYLDERSNRSPAQLRSTTLWAIGKGAKAAILWQWRPELFGQESPHFGVTTADGDPTPRSEAVREIGAMLQRHSDLFDALSPASPQVGLILDVDTLAYEDISAPIRPPLATAKVAGEPQSMWNDHFRGTYRALIDQGYGVDILNARELSDGEVPPSLKVLVLPTYVIERPGLIDKLSSWVQAGGTLVAGPLCAQYAPDTYTNRPQPPAPVQQLFGVAQDGDLVYPLSPLIELVPNTAFRTAGTLLPSTFVVQPLRPVDGAEVIGVCGEFVAATAARRGGGLAVMLGSPIGSRYSRTERSGLAEFLDAVCRQAGVTPGAKGTSGVLAQVAHSQARTLLFLHNPAEEAVDTWVSAGERVEGPVVDLLTDDVLIEAKGGQPIKLHLEPRDSRVLAIG